MVTKLKSISKKVIISIIALIMISSCSFAITNSIRIFTENEDLINIYYNDVTSSRLLRDEIYSIMQKIIYYCETKDEKEREIIKSKICQINCVKVRKGNTTIQSNNAPQNFEILKSDKYEEYVAIFNNKVVSSIKGFDYFGECLLVQLSDKQDVEIYVGFTDDFLNNIRNKLNNQHVVLIKQIKQSFIALVIFIISFIIFLVNMLYKIKNKNAKSGIYNDVILLLLAAIILLVKYNYYNIYHLLLNNNFLVIKYNFYSLYETLLSNNYLIYYLICFTIVFILSSFIFYIILHIIKNIAMKRFFKNTLLYKIFSRSTKSKVSAIFSLLIYTVLCCISPIVAAIVFIIALLLILRLLNDLNKIKNSIREIKNNSNSYNVKLDTKGKLLDIFKDINEIGTGFKEAVERETKSQRLKTELITNVSHDIRTPLTSIITYVDLLKQEKNQEKKDKFIKIIEQKSQRLKVLTDDLFEASKANSKDISTKLEKIDIISLINQSIGELNEEIAKYDLDFIINSVSEPCYALADGKLLWRVVENLLSNVFKYAQTKSRVYWDILQNDDCIKIELKNISKHKLNIQANELFERFKRGDESRSTEGSGLGLCIAKGFIESQGGKLDINIDGDLFKVIIILSRYKEEIK